MGARETVPELTPDEDRQLKRIIELFAYCKEQNPRATDDDYQRFCKYLLYAPWEVLVRASKEVQFVLMTHKPGYSMRAFCMSLKRAWNLKRRKKHLIVLSPILFGYCPRDNRKELDNIQDTLHELAHFHLGHDLEKEPSLGRIDEMDKDADALVDEWIPRSVLP
jgi:hypothetical protein